MENMQCVVNHKVDYSSLSSPAVTETEESMCKSDKLLTP